MGMTSSALSKPSPVFHLFLVFIVVIKFFMQHEKLFIFFNERIHLTHGNSCIVCCSLFVAIAIEAFNKLGTLDEEQQLRPHIERQPSEQRPPSVDV